jgi:hypothetical protein
MFTALLDILLDMGTNELFVWLQPPHSHKFLKHVELER